MGVHRKNVYNDAVIVNGVDEAVLTVDAAGPHACQRVFQGLGLTNARIRMLGYVGKQEFDAAHHFHITALDKGVVMRNRRLGKDYSVHVMRSSSWSIDSPSC